jgi:hypothetical protein
VDVLGGLLASPGRTTGVPDGRVLLISESPEGGASIQRALTALACEVSSVEGFSQAAGVAREGRFDLVVLRGNGLSPSLTGLTTRLHSEAGSSRWPVLVALDDLAGAGEAPLPVKETVGAPVDPEDVALRSLLLMYECRLEART